MCECVCECVSVCECVCEYVIMKYLNRTRIVLEVSTL